MTLLPKDTRFDPNKGTLEIEHSHGFFSNCTLTLCSLTVIHPQPRRITVNWTKQEQWRDRETNQANLFADYFRTGEGLPSGRLSNVASIRHHDPYYNIPFKLLNPYISEYFSPSTATSAMIAHLTNRYDIKPEKLVGLCYRGTDKITEVGGITPSYYFD